jgi:outer membrane protein assembly factor BamB
MRLLSVVAVSAVMVLTGCEGWFGGSDEKPLPGLRISVLALESALKPDPRIADLAVRLPRPMANRDWPQAGGTANHAMHHLSAKGKLEPLWESGIGAGSGDDGQLLAQPVVANKRVFTMDVEAHVRAFDADTGAEIWRQTLKSGIDDDGMLGGGLAVHGDRLFATTGFGEVFALDAASGKEIWRRATSGPLRAAPTVFGGRVFVITLANELYALDAGDGRVLWTYVGITENVGLVGAASPAVQGSVVVAPFTSGEVVALRVENGRQIWSESLTALRRANPVASMAHIRGRPVIDGGRVFITGNSGRTVAVDLRTGNRLWERPIGGVHGPWVVGDFIYVLSRDGELVCLTRRDGAVRWVRTLQRYEDEKDKEGLIVWAGPVVAGDRVIVAGSHGEIWSISPYTGKLLGRIKAPGPILIPPIVAGDTLYFLTEEAELVALR